MLRGRAVAFVTAGLMALSACGGEPQPQTPGVLATAPQFEACAYLPRSADVFVVPALSFEPELLGAEGGPLRIEELEVVTSGLDIVDSYLLEYDYSRPAAELPVWPAFGIASSSAQVQFFVDSLTGGPISSAQLELVPGRAYGVFVVVESSSIDEEKAPRVEVVGITYNFAGQPYSDALTTAFNFEVVDSIFEDRPAECSNVES